VFEYSLTEKWLDLLKVIAPSPTPVAIREALERPGDRPVRGDPSPMSSSSGAKLRAIDSTKTGRIKRWLVFGVIGDAMGTPTENPEPADIEQRFGCVESFEGDGARQSAGFKPRWDYWLTLRSLRLEKYGRPG
jgi:hypothetical protein